MYSISKIKYLHFVNLGDLLRRVTKLKCFLAFLRFYWSIYFCVLALYCTVKKWTL